MDTKSGRKGEKKAEIPTFGIWISSKRMPKQIFPNKRQEDRKVGVPLFVSMETLERLWIKK